MTVSGNNITFHDTKTTILEKMPGKSSWNKKKGKLTNRIYAWNIKNEGNHDFLCLKGNDNDICLSKR